MDFHNKTRNAILSLIKSSPTKLTYHQIAKDPLIHKLIYESRVSSGQDPKRYDLYWREVKRRLHQSPERKIPIIIIKPQPIKDYLISDPKYKSSPGDPEQEKIIDERLKMEQEHERTFGDQTPDDFLNPIYPWCETYEDYYAVDSFSPFILPPEEEEFNDLFAEAIFKGIINTDPAPNKLTDPEAIYYRWQALFNHNPEKTIKELEELVENI